MKHESVTENLTYQFPLMVYETIVLPFLKDYRIEHSHTHITEKRAIKVVAAMTKSQVTLLEELVNIHPQ